MKLQCPYILSMKYLSVGQNCSKVDVFCFIFIPSRVSLGTTDVNWQCFYHRSLQVYLKFGQRTFIFKCLYFVTVLKVSQLIFLWEICLYVTIYTAHTAAVAKNWSMT